MTGPSRSQREANLFSEQQEEWLGDIMDQEIREDFNIIEDPSGYLQKFGEHLLTQLPPTSIHYRFVIIDSPELNSFGVAGGRIYIHRRLIAFARNEDELAALLGHEIGHIIDHHVAIQVSSLFRSLGINSVGDQQDVIAKWNQFESNARRTKERNAERRQEEEQLIADRIGLHAMLRAGYDQNSMFEFLDRLLQTKGKTGGFWSDFFGITTPGSKRLREFVKNSGPLPKECIALRVPDPDGYSRWQKSIIESQRSVARVDLPGLVRKVSLQPPLRGDLDHIRVSPDGKYLLAQDESSVFVLTREPLASLFRIDALDAHLAQFSPDSKFVVFYDKELRVEKWDIESKERVSLRLIAIPSCFQSVLSPSSEFLGCIDHQFTLQIVDVNSGKIIYTRKQIYNMNWFEYYYYFLARLDGVSDRFFDLKFSPDDRYFVIGHLDSSLAYDLKAGAEVHLPGGVKALLRATFAFTAPDEIAGYDIYSNALVRVRFPSGKKIDDFKLPADGWLSSTDSHDYLLVRPAGTYPVGIIDLKARKLDQAFKTPAFAVYGDTFIGEQNSGEIGIFSAHDKKMIGKVQLPESPLPQTRIAAFSRDGQWLAVSGRSRGSLWKLDNGERTLFTHAFQGALFEKQQVVAQFARYEAHPSQVFQLDLASKGATKLYDLPVDALHRHTYAYQTGDLLLVLRPEKEKQDIDYVRTIMDVRDIHNNSTLWSRKLNGRPSFFYTGGKFALLTRNWDNIRAAAKEDPVLQARLQTVDDKHDAYVLQVFDPHSGTHLGSLLVDTGKRSFEVESAYTFGDTVFVGDSENRTLVYSLRTNQQKGALVGSIVAATSTGDRVLIENGDGLTQLFDTTTLQPVTHFNFPSRVVGARFIENGSLMVLTADQSVYQVEPDKGVAAQASGKAPEPR